MINLKIGNDNPFFYYLAFFGVFCVYCIGALLDIMDVDAAQYASISRDMMQSGEYLQIKERGKDYLDKPPLLFWFSALSFSVFGVFNFAYRIFPILFTVLGAYSTYQFAKLYYNAKTGALAALTLVSCQAFFLIHHDVRTDTMLADAVIFAIWQIALFNEQKKLKNLCLGFAGIALSMLAKGPIGLMVPVLAFTSDFILKRKWFSFFRWQWLLGLLIVLIILSPMCYGLYVQFDLQPDKIVNNKTNVSGLYFYFWEQSFGRLTGENVWKDDSDAFFFVHSFLWSFLPWALLFIPALWNDITNIFRKRFKITASDEVISLAGFILPFIALSFSHYKLPHYIYVVFPLAAIITGKYLYFIIYEEKALKWFTISKNLQIFTIIVLWIAVFLLAFVSFPLTNIFIILISFIIFSAGLYFVFRSKNRFQTIIYPSFLTILGVNFLLNIHIYPTLFQYQSGSVAARFMRYESSIKPQKCFVFTKEEQIYIHSLDFYGERYLAGQINNEETLIKEAKKGKLWIYTDEKGLKEIQVLQQKLKVLREFEDFRVSQMNIKFLNPQNRHKELKRFFVLEFVLE